MASCSPPPVEAPRAADVAYKKLCKSSQMSPFYQENFSVSPCGKGVDTKMAIPSVVAALVASAFVAEMARTPPLGFNTCVGCVPPVVCCGVQTAPLAKCIHLSARVQCMCSRTQNASMQHVLCSIDPGGLHLEGVRFYVAGELAYGRLECGERALSKASRS